MQERNFHLRSRAVHEGEANDLVSLEMEIELESGWEAVALGLKSPPFRAFVCTALMCQHAYLRMNAAERGLTCSRAEAEFWMNTDDFFVKEIRAAFKLVVTRGTPSAEDLAFISERMRDCPISRNLADVAKTTTLELISAP